MSDDKEILNRIDIFKELNEELDDYENLLDTLYSNDDYDYTKLMEHINPKDRLDLNWQMGYSTFSLYYSIQLVEFFSLFEITKFGPQRT